MGHYQRHVDPSNNPHIAIPCPAHSFINNVLKGRLFSAAGFWEAGSIRMADIII